MVHTLFVHVDPLPVPVGLIVVFVVVLVIAVVSVLLNTILGYILWDLIHKRKSVVSDQNRLHIIGSYYYDLHVIVCVDCDNVLCGNGVCIILLHVFITGLCTIIT